MADTSTQTQRPQRAGLFDIRYIIGALLGLYGVILVVTGFFTSDSQLNKSGGLNINLVAGGCMILAALAFGAWARWRPVIVPPDPQSPQDEAERPAERPNE